MEATVYCAAIDFTNGACTVHYSNDYDESKLDFNNRATHYRLVPCPHKDTGGDNASSTLTAGQ